LDLGEIKSKFEQNSGEIWTKVIKFRKIKILHPQKHSISYDNAGEIVYTLV